MASVATAPAHGGAGRLQGHATTLEEPPSLNDPAVRDLATYLYLARSGHGLHSHSRAPRTAHDADMVASTRDRGGRREDFGDGLLKLLVRGCVPYPTR